MRLRTLVLSGLAVLAIAACETEERAAPEPVEEEEREMAQEMEPEEEEPVGVAEAAERSERRADWVGYLRPLNDSGVSGTVTISARDENVTIEVEALGLAPNMNHRMMIHQGGECPDADMDPNDDGFLAVTEGMPAYGPVLVPLDSQLADLAENEYPRVGSDGALNWSQTGSIIELTNALHESDPTPDDPFVRLGEQEALDFEERTIVIHGVGEDREIPDTVESLPNVAAQETLPVACAPLELGTATGS